MNLAGHDAVFEAERAIAGDDEEGKEESVEGKRGWEFVEWLLGCKEAGGWRGVLAVGWWLRGMRMVMLLVEMFGKG